MIELDQHFILSITHLLFVVPLLLFVGFKRAATPHWLYMAIFAIGAIIIVYHGFKLIIRLRTNSGYIWVNILHILIVAPLLLYIGYNKKNTPRFAYELLLMLAFAAAGYHMFSIIRYLDISHESNL
jgi:hypothetical protein